MLSRLNKVAIVGRPNVGKSTLFNIATNARRAIVKNQPGVTRDIQYGKAEWRGHEFEVMDTGGVTESNDLMPKLIKEKVIDALKISDMTLVIVDAQAGLIPEDKVLLDMVQRSGKPFRIVVNKLDTEENIGVDMADFYQLGGELIPCSFEKRQGIADILDWIVDSMPVKDDTKIESELTFAILGKPNVGKSSLTNKLLDENRMIVSPVAGTTVDAIDIPFERNGRTYTIIDTAGLRKKSKIEDGVEIIATIKSRGVIPRADIVLLMVDILEGPTEQDAKILRQVQEEHKTVLLVGNKSDEAKIKVPAFREKFKAKVEEVFHFYPDIPVVFISALTSAGVEELFKKIDELWEKVNTKITTGELNRFFTQVIKKAPAPVYRTGNVKFYYLTQTQQTPPCFIAFVNHPEGVDNSYRRFLAKQIKEEWGLWGVPIRIFAMKGRHAE
ncbi:MAG: ribosome biogenesis GTPase Der [Bdellovibrionota bacterium]